MNKKYIIMKLLIKILLSIALFGYLYNKFSKKKTLRLEENNK